MGKAKLRPKKKPTAAKAARSKKTSGKVATPKVSVVGIPEEAELEEASRDLNPNDGIGLPLHPPAILRELHHRAAPVHGGRWRRGNEVCPPRGTAIALPGDRCGHGSSGRKSNVFSDGKHGSRPGPGQGWRTPAR